MNDLPRMNAGVAGLTVGIFGGQSVPEEMADVPDTFDSMVVTHICRIDAQR